MIKQQTRWASLSWSTHKKITELLKAQFYKERKDPITIPEITQENYFKKQENTFSPNTLEKHNIKY